MYPGFAEYSWPSSRVTPSLFRWKVPRSNIWLPLVQVSGEWCDAAETLSVKWELALLSYTMHASGGVLDATRATLGNELAVPCGDWSIRLRRLGIVAQPKDIQRFRAPVEALFNDQKKAAVYVAESFRRFTHDAKKPIVEGSVLNTMEPARPSADLVEFSCFVSELGNERIALFRITGQYPDGAVGKEHAAVVSWQLDRFTDAVKPSGVIVDVRDFEYEYGDDLRLYPDAFGRGSAIRFLVGKKGQGSFDMRSEEACETLDSCLAGIRQMVSPT